jgi:hypothetical protein
MAGLLEPYLTHNRAEFARLKRLQVGFMVAAPGGGLLLALVAAITPIHLPYDWFMMSLVIVALIGMGVMEVRKVLVFRRDLRELRDGRAPASSTGGRKDTEGGE